MIDNFEKFLSKKKVEREFLLSWDISNVVASW
jgi:hypothetical protein